MDRPERSTLTLQVSTAMAFELPLADRFSVADIDPHTSYLCRLTKGSVFDNLRGGK